MPESESFKFDYLSAFLKGVPVSTFSDFATMDVCLWTNEREDYFKIANRLNRQPYPSNP
ncbi:hypothetical protein BGX33_001138, partial [Mortierella sp. NVP41]